MKTRIDQGKEIQYCIHCSFHIVDYPDVICQHKASKGTHTVEWTSKGNGAKNIMKGLRLIQETYPGEIRGTPDWCPLPEKAAPVIAQGKVK